MATQPATSQSPSIIDRVLRLFSDVRGGEGFTALLLMSNLFLLLTAYLIIKVVREALILGEGGAVVKSYAAAGQALLLLGVVPIYSVVASRVRRIQLINGVTSFCILVFFLFYLFGRLGFALGVPFFLWVGIFNLFVVAQFWSFANDLYSEEQGKRLFPIIAFGGGLGAILGPKLASMLFQSSRRRWTHAARRRDIIAVHHHGQLDPSARNSRPSRGQSGKCSVEQTKALSSWSSASAISCSSPAHGDSQSSQYHRRVYSRPKGD